MENEIGGACIALDEKGRILDNCSRKTCTVIGIAPSVQWPGYGLENRGRRVQLPTASGDLSLLQSVQTRSGALSASHTLGTAGSFPGGGEADKWTLLFAFI
jgi:hypothetical protein